MANRWLAYYQTVLLAGVLLLFLQHLVSAVLGVESPTVLTDYIAAGFIGGAGLASLLNMVHCADVPKFLRSLPPRCVQTVIADPPYFQVLPETWDNQWASFQEYLEWSMVWLQECMRVLRRNGLCFIFGQVGRREWGFLDFCSQATHLYQFHDLIVWDRAVGYQRRDSVDPAYELILVLRNSDRVKFFKHRVRTPYDQATILKYAKDKRYKSKAARLAHLRRGKYATNIIRVPSLRGSSWEKVGHTCQKPLDLVRKLILLTTDRAEVVLDPFAGSGTTAVAAMELGRRWISIERKPKYCRMIERRLASVAAPKE